MTDDPGNKLLNIHNSITNKTLQEIHVQLKDKVGFSHSFSPNSYFCHKLGVFNDEI